ncbi:MAG: rhomboid family intramembrane serine protease [Acidobacteria bacterium]|nr:rhomboid family intramembrane serine protease [Acidobacteriota bacterium]
MTRSYSRISYQFGPGRVTPAVKALLIANGVLFLVQIVMPMITVYGGLTPAAVIESLWLWQPFSYMFLHAGLSHLVFNMLALWMFGTELEQIWGTRAFVRFYMACGLGAAATTMVASLLPFSFADFMYVTPTVGASGAIYGLLAAYGIIFANRPIYMYFLFPVPARIFVLITGAITLLMSVTSSGGGIAHLAHLGGLATGAVLMLRGSGSGGLMTEIKYRYTKWRLQRARRNFDVHRGGRGGWNVH